MGGSPPTDSVFVLQRGYGVLRALHRSWVQQVVPQKLPGKGGTRAFMSNSKVSSKVTSSVVLVFCFLCLPVH